MFAALVAAVALVPQASGIELEICQDPPGAEAPSPDNCESQTAKPKPGGSGDKRETHDIDVGTGERRVTTPGGEESVELDLKDDPHDAFVPPPDRPASTPAEDQDSGEALPVSTNGGALPGIGASPFDFISEDEALASFAVPPFLLPIYVAAGRAYDVPWNVLASINKIETDFGRLGACVRSYAGAEGWMQFLPSTWAAYGVDASGDGVADPCNPVDAIYAAARYLDASGGSADIRRAIFAYNHADWYVDEVLSTASAYGSLPPGLVTETSSLAYGHFPVRGPVQYGDDFRAALRNGRTPHGLSIHAEGRATAIATQELTVKTILVGPRAASALRRVPVARRPAPVANGAVAQLSHVAPLAPLIPAAERVTGLRVGRALGLARRLLTGGGAAGPDHGRGGLPPGYAPSKVRGMGVELRDGAGNIYRYEGLQKLRRGIAAGVRLRAAQPIGSLHGAGKAPLVFGLRGAGGALIDPRPIVDGYRLQEAANFYNAVAPLGASPFVSDLSSSAGVVSGTQRELARRVLADPGITIYDCGRQDIQSGIIDQRVLGALLYLRRSGLTLSITSLRCGHSYLTAGGSVSAHSFGAAVDIVAFNGQPVLGNQGPGSLIEHAVRLLLRLEGDARPTQLISLMDLDGGSPTSFALGDHDDHLHLGYSFDTSLGLGRTGDIASDVVFGPTVPSGANVKATPGQERKLSERAGTIENPGVLRKPGPDAVPVEAENPGERARATQTAVKRTPIAATESSAGAALQDIAEHGPGRAYAIGKVDGAALGWARQQSVFLVLRGDQWRQIGPPLGANGKPVNPGLKALATDDHGYGYAVGRGGAVVRLRGTRPPLLMHSPANKTLHDVALDDGRGDAGVAVGGDGVAVKLHRATATSTHAAGVGATLRAVETIPAGYVAVGSTTIGEPLVLRNAEGTWRSLDPPTMGSSGAALRLTSVAIEPGGLWVGGAVATSSALGTKADLPFLARSQPGGWLTFCPPNPALSNVAELGRSAEAGCNRALGSADGLSGPVADIAVTSRGVVIAGRPGIEIMPSGTRTFRPVSGSPASPPALSLARSGEGWAVGGSGRLVRVILPSAPGNISISPVALPINAGVVPSAVAMPPAGGRALIFAGGETAVLHDEGWSRGAPTGLAIRDAAFAGDSDSLWGIDESGSLLTGDAAGGSWEIPGADGRLLAERAALVQRLGGQPLSPETAKHSGLQAISFGSGIEGYAVGANGIITRYLANGWSPERSGTGVTLHDVAVGPAGVIAAGDKGTVLERTDDGWRPSEEAAALAGRGAVTATAVLADATTLVAAGSILERAPDGAWSRADLPPLGVAVDDMAGFRDDAGDMHVVALVGAPGARALLEGTLDGWRAIDLPSGLRPEAFAAEPGTERILVAGMRDGSPASTVVDLGTGR